MDARFEQEALGPPASCLPILRRRSVEDGAGPVSFDQRALAVPASRSLPAPQRKPRRFGPS
jgi:hypothetical protein